MPIDATADETWTVDVRANIKPFETAVKDAASLGRGFSTTLASAFDGVVAKGKGLGDVLKSLALHLSDLVLKSALKPLDGLFGSALNSALSGGLFSSTSAAVSTSSLPIPFAQGGVIASPIGFPLGGGRSGLAGEAGAEAIMPLARGSDGRLGVAVSGQAPGPSITFNVTTADAQSFARSQSQIAAMLARAVSLGQRNL
jgi:phage-related minor tail protein